MARQSLELKEKLFGEEHTMTLDSMNALASILFDLGKYMEGEGMTRRLEIRLKLLGKDD